MADRPGRRGRKPSHAVEQQYTGNEATETGNAPTSDGQEEFGGSRRSAHHLPSAKAVSGGALLPILKSRVLTQSEVKDLKNYTLKIEEELLRHEETCRVCMQHFEFGSDDIKQHYRQHSANPSCPYCDQDWTNVKREEQLDHLQESHEDNLSASEPQLCPYPDCSVNLADRREFPSLSRVLRHVSEHIAAPAKDIDPRRHASVGIMTDQAREDHAEMHDQPRSVGAIPKKKSTRNQKGTQTTARDIDQDRHDLTVARDTAPPPNKKRKQNQRETPTALTGIGLDDQDSAITKQIASGSSAETDGEQAQQEEPNGPDQSEGPEVGGRMYCNVCLRTVEKLGEAGRGKHAAQCGTNVTQFLTLSEADVKKARSDRKKGKDKAPAAESKFKEKTPAVKHPKPVAAKHRDKLGKEPVPAAESAAESSGPNRKIGHQSKDRSAEPPNDDEAPISKPSIDEAATARPKRRPKADIKAIVEKNLRRKN